MSRRLTAAAALGTGAIAVLLAGCSAETAGQFTRLGLPEAASDRSPAMFGLWIGAWTAAVVVGIFTWGLIAWAVLRYRRKDNAMPKQNRYNLPMEIMYTIIPFIIVGVLFYFTVVTQNRVLERSAEPDHVVKVIGQKWSWTFNYAEADNPAVGEDVYQSGTIENTPDLYLPVGKSVLFELRSPDVIHSFWVPAFYQKLDVVPGRNNSFEVTPTKTGVFQGKCSELCGTYHSAMLFNVHVVSEDEYHAYLKTLIAKGQTGEATGAALGEPAVEGR